MLRFHLRVAIVPGTSRTVNTERIPRLSERRLAAGFGRTIDSALLLSRAKPAASQRSQGRPCVAWVIGVN